MDEWMGWMDGFVSRSFLVCANRWRYSSRAITLDTSTLKRSHEDADAINNLPKC